MLIWTLQSLQGHFSGDHFLIAFLNDARFPLSVSSFDTKSHIIGPKNDTISAVVYGAYFWSIKLRKFPYVICLFTLSLKISFIRTGDKPLLTLNISITKICRFLWCKDTELSFSNYLMNDDCLSLYIILKHLSWSRFIFLLFVRLWHIHFKGQ